MEANGEQEPDTESFKPVSSLRAKFEGLHGNNATRVQLPGHRHTPTSLRAHQPGGQSPLARASFDLPRPHSPWTSASAEAKLSPRTPDRVRGGSESPTKLGHKRPLSMLGGSSPQLAPSVQIHSPKSPPQTVFARPSASPKRKNLGNVLVHVPTLSQPSSTGSTRASSPGVSNAENLPSNVPGHQTQIDQGGTARSKSPAPPPINRAEKPKLPVTVKLHTDAREYNLFTKSDANLADRKVSPFNTPPSSDEEDVGFGQANQESLDRTMRSPPSPRRTQTELGSTERSVSKEESSTVNDLRSMGFTAPKLNVDKRDARYMGLSSASAAISPSRETSSQMGRVESNTVLKAARDSRTMGFVNAAPDLQQTAQTSPPMRRSSTQETSKTTPSRDARFYGFSSATSNIATTAVDDTGPPQLPSRSIAKIPAPPRPSEESKRPVYAPGIARSNTAKIPSSSPVVQPQPRHVSEVLRHNTINVGDIKFPPPPRRSGTVDEDQREMPQRSTTFASLTTGSRRVSVDHPGPAMDDSDEAEAGKPEPIVARHEYPDATQTNRRPPISNSKVWRIDGRTDGKVFAVCGRYLCTAGYHTRVFDFETGQCILDMNHGEVIKVTAVCFKPGDTIDSEGKRLWLGNNNGDLLEVDILKQEVTMQSAAHNRRAVVNIFRHKKDLWTLDEAGNLCVWPADESGMPSLKYSHIAQRLSRPPTFAMAVHDDLWVASGKEVRIYKPGADSSFNVSKDILIQSASGDITCGTFSEEHGGRVYLGHADGKLSVYSTKTLTCTGNLKISDYKFNGVVFVEGNLWAAFKTGKVYVYDTSCTPWRVVKDWRAHDGPAAGIALDYSGVWTLGRLQVITSGHEGLVKLWDGWLEDDAIDDAVRERDVEFCTFRSVHAAVTTWNAGAVSPALLRTDFLADAVHADDPDPPEILVFGFQEVVDLEDKSVTAKSILGFGKRKDVSSDSQHQSRVYREWRDYLAKQLASHVPNHQYIELHTSSLIGLFFCIFIRQDQKQYVSGHAGSNVKCGMSGHYGNKGALIARLIYDSTSLCLVNCHLAAGQAHTSHRNNDLAKILEAEPLPSEPDLEIRSSLYVGGGDGGQILDHEICVLNGDLNYRIDAIPRDTVIKMIANNELTKLLERDQIMVSRKRVSGFRLAPFTEAPITFAPTYKYDVGKDTYDSSDKKRSPAWCDRILYRGAGGGGANPSAARVKQLEYRRHDSVRASDHRPVSGLFRFKIKRVDQEKRRRVHAEVIREFDGVKRKRAQKGCIEYLVAYFDVDEREARKLIMK